ncbi:MAG: UDP-N-acetylmuramoyl-L-alanyl-D-glutamate--2,6-diaminopimelate ligase [Clostridiales Family XIII bacterium]|jgi:UDP-N-acetylmuramoyl-L-alanyl-D-glutamate--2,6-diaminopimelate ligase|nr:UDP-N-acetylmuramoyl-L-alanyl-D-glutamate--2,6-diaminopimelate ligase [Clostridiales Family XIII bacterium]
MTWIKSFRSIADYIDLFKKKGCLAELRGDFLAKADTTVKALSYDSRSVTPGTIFFCKGAHFSPDYLHMALEKGAIAYVCEPALAGRLSDSIAPSEIPGIVVTDVRTAITNAAALHYEGLREQLTIIGYTGTKGKSTTSYFTKAIFDSWMQSMGKPLTAILSGINNYDGIVDEESHLTTPETFELYRHFENAVRSGISHLTMEVSSQALKYGRTRGIGFDVAGFLNVGEDHISPIEHSDREDYLAAKLKVFENSRIACINLESEDLPRIRVAAENSERVVTFGLSKEADVYAHSARAEAGGVTFTVRTAEWEAPFSLCLSGLFNIENALAGISSAYALGLPLPFLQNGLATAKVPGRMELFRAPGGRVVLVDYAHNKLSYETLFASVAWEYPNCPIVTVLGAPGGKAYDRRRDLPQIAAPKSHKIYITEEDYGEEALSNINAEIFAVATEVGGNAEIVEDRGEAIERAILESPENAVVLILGKGRETRQKRGMEYVETEADAEIVERLIREARRKE